MRKNYNNQVGINNYYVYNICRYMHRDLTFETTYKESLSPII